MLKKLILKFLGNYLEKKAELYEGTPESGKPWYQSKSILVGVYLSVVGLYETARTVARLTKGVELPEFPTEIHALAGSILGPLVIQGRINANKPIEP